jgi:cell division septal protein FtsQ
MVRPSHLSALLLFALFSSLALAGLTQRSTAGRVRYAAWSFFLFLAVGVGIAWLMYPFSH